MSVYPKWLLCLCFPSLLSLLASPIYLFGNLRLFGNSDSTIVNLLLYVLQNGLWLLPIFLFFAALNIYGRGHEKTGTAIAIANLFLTILCFILPF